MTFTPVERIQIKNALERVLHVPGNYNGGILEMAMVFDCNLSKEAVGAMGKNIANLLKTHSEVFRNVRLNGIFWEEDEVFLKELTSLPHLQMGKYFENYQCCVHSKRLELLAWQLKKFYARSKLILLFTDGNYRIEDTALYQENMRPFLYRKLVLLECKPDSESPDGNYTQSNHIKIKVYTGAELLKL